MNKDQLKIIFWGTPEFAIPSLMALIKDGYRIVAVVTNPDEPVGREQILTPTPVKVTAENYGITVFQPAVLDVKFLTEELPEADLSVIVAYGKIIPEGLIKFPRLGSINIHPSLLPKLRGPSPIQYAILNGEAETGVSLMVIDSLMDHGPIIMQESIKIKPRANYSELSLELSKIGAKILTENILKWVSGEIKAIPQDDSQATFSKMIKKDDGRIDWKRPAEEIDRKIRAFNIWPGAWTLWPSKDKIYRIRIEESNISFEEPVEGSPGFVWSKNKNLFVKTGKCSLEIKKITIEGKKEMSAESFLNGYSNALNTTFV